MYLFKSLIILTVNKSLYQEAESANPRKRAGGEKKAA